MQGLFTTGIIHNLLLSGADGIIPAVGGLTFNPIKLINESIDAKFIEVETIP